VVYAPGRELGTGAAVVAGVLTLGVPGGRVSERHRPLASKERFDLERELD